MGTTAARGGASASVKKVDGRNTRSDATKLAIVRATYELAAEMSRCPQVSEIALRARRSVWSVFHHFDEVGNLHLIVLRWAMAEIDTNIAEIPPSLSFAERLESTIKHYTLIHEPLCIAWAVSRSRHATAETAFTMGELRKQLSAELLATFAPELEHHSNGMRRQVSAAICAACDVDMWMGQNEILGDLVHVAGVVRRMLEALLKQ